MITHSLTREQPCSEINWQQQYRDSITNIDDLCTALNLHVSQLPISLSGQQQFSVRVPKSYIQRMQKSNPQDPLLLQVLPHAYEDNNTTGYTTDPVGDLQCIKSPGLLIKYNRRALLLATSRCAVHCRYCFRRHFPYSLHNPRVKNWERAIKEITADISINEVILSGGDPLVLPDNELAKLIEQLESIKHIERLRIHTRLPVVIPTRINNDFMKLVSGTKLKVVIVLHVNHYQELDYVLQNKLQQLSLTQCTLLNQSVLLKNINDNSDILVKLSDVLFKANVLPYYLHILDKVQGAAHFYVCEKQACKIMSEVANKLPGYLVPKLVKEEAGRPSKTLVAY